ncbi:hypothetical protein [Rhizobium leguminosarum]|uniref:hypothetical protein n=1 Tax=Rhizobium leguminosarum TaxID=384 RepID=UPI003F9C9229
MPGQYPFNIDITTRAGQDEISSLWSAAKLSVGQAAWITKLMHKGFFALAQERGVTAPSFTAVAQTEAELEARVVPIVRQGERERRRKLTGLLDEARELAEGISRSMAFEPEGANKDIADHKGEAASRERLAVGSLPSALIYLDVATKWGSDHDPGIG